MNLFTLEKILNTHLNSAAIKDYAPNGLQVEGGHEVRKIITGVTASQALIDRAIALNADALLVHHGYFWKGEDPVVTGMKKQRLRSLLMNDISLLGYHLPLDVHPILGNNACLAHLWGINKILPLDCEAPLSIPVWGEFTAAITGEALNALITQTLNRKPYHSFDNAPKLIKKVAWCSGGAQDYIALAAKHHMDAFITGEVSERTVHIAREMGMHFFAAGHHATERYGVKALGEWLIQTHGLDVTFVDIDNPI